MRQGLVIVNTGNGKGKTTAALGTKEFPKVMREAATKLKSRADGKLINEVVKELTANRQRSCVEF